MRSRPPKLEINEAARTLELMSSGIAYARQCLTIATSFTRFQAALPHDHKGTDRMRTSPAGEAISIDSVRQALYVE